MVEAAKPLGPQPTSREPWRAIFLAILLGLLAGFVHGWNLSLAALLILVVFFNVRARLFFAIWFLGVALSWLLVPISYAAGRFVLDRTPVGEFFGLLGDTPVVSMFGWDRYTLIGGGVIALLLAVPAYITIRGWIQKFRAADDAESGPEQHSAPNRLVRWLLLTERAPVATVADAQLVRPLGLWAALIATGAASMAVWWIAPKRAETVLLTRLTDACGAPITTGAVALDLWGGMLDIENLTIADPDVPAQERLHIAKLSARLDTTALLQGRLHIEQLDIAGIEWHPDAVGSVDDVSKDALAPLRTETCETDQLPNILVEPETFVRTWSHIEDSMTRLERFVTLIERGQHLDESIDAGQRKRQRFAMRYLTQRRSHLGVRRPAVFAQHVVVSDFPDAWTLGPKATLRLADLSSLATCGPRATRLEFLDPMHGLSLCAHLNLRDVPYRHRLELKTGEFVLPQYVIAASSTQRLLCEDGRASMSAEGWLTQGKFDLAVQLHVKQLTAQLAGQAPVADIPVDTWNEALASLSELRIVSRLSGTAAGLETQVVTTELRRDIDGRLRKQGDIRLASAFSVPGDITHPSARIVATRALSTDHASSSMGPYATPAIPPLPAATTDRQAVASHGLSPNSTAGTRPRLERLPEVFDQTSARPHNETPVSISFTPPSKPAAKTVVREAPEVAVSAQMVDDPWTQATSTSAVPAAAAVAANPPVRSDTTNMTPDVNYLPEDDEESPSAKGRWTDDAVARLSHLFKFKERDPPTANPFNEAAVEPEGEPRLSDSRDGSRYSSSRTAAPPTVRIVR